MKNTAIIIPTRLGAKRFPNKPLAKINDIPMIVHVMNRAKETGIRDVFVASGDKKILDIVKANGGETIFTKNNHPSGSDRTYEAYAERLKNRVELIINLQGDMPNIKPSSILNLDKLMKSNTCDVGTLAAPLKKHSDIENPNIVKVYVEKDLQSGDFVNAKDFFRKKKNINNERVYHHIGIYAFTSNALTKYVKLPRSKLEIERNLEQMRAMENSMNIKVGLSNSIPLGVDTELDLKEVANEMSHQ